MLIWTIEKIENKFGITYGKISEKLTMRDLKTMLALS